MRQYFKLILILLIPLLLMVIYSYLPIELPLEKIDLSGMPIIASNDTITAPTDTSATDTTSAETNTTKEGIMDTTSKRILFFGDSMIEGLGPRMCDYAMENGHTLYTVCWYSSTTEHWAVCDTLQYYLNLAKPDYIMISIGGNEQFNGNLDKRIQFINIIKKKIGQIPIVWICTPEWKKDVKFNIMLKEQVGDSHFFDSRRLTYERRSDHAHPTPQSASKWMDSIAVWMQSPACSHPIRMKMPTEKRTRNWNATYLKPQLVSKLPNKSKDI